MSVIDFTHNDITNLINTISQKIENKHHIDLIVAVGRGGFVPAVYLSHKLGVKKMVACFIDTYDNLNVKKPLVLGTDLFDQSGMLKISKSKSVLVVDDIVDSGQTFTVLSKWFNLVHPKTKIQYACLVYKLSATFSDVIYGFEHRDDSWVKFPWEVD